MTTTTSTQSRSTIQATTLRNRVHDDGILNDGHLVPGDVQLLLNRVERVALKLERHHAASVDQNVEPATGASQREAKGRLGGDADADANQPVELSTDHLAANH